MLHVHVQARFRDAEREVLTDAEMRLMFGWSPNSKVPGRYKQVYGSGKPVEPPEPRFAPVVSPRCQEKGSPG